jgi:hypothetical protein
MTTGRINQVAFAAPHEQEMSALAQGSGFFLPFTELFQSKEWNPLHKRAKKSPLLTVIVATTNKEQSRFSLRTYKSLLVGARIQQGQLSVAISVHVQG